MIAIKNGVSAEFEDPSNNVSSIVDPQWLVQEAPWYPFNQYSNEWETGIDTMLKKLSMKTNGTKKFIKYQLKYQLKIDIQIQSQM